MRKKLPMLALFVMIQIMAYSQKANMNFYTANEEKFFLVINGIQQNEIPMSNIHLTNMPAPVMYSVRVKFANSNIPVIDDRVTVQPDMEKTWIIQPKLRNANSPNAYAIKAMGEIAIENENYLNSIQPNQIVVYHADAFSSQNSGNEGVSFNMNVNDDNAHVSMSIGGTGMNASMNGNTSNTNSSSTSFSSNTNTSFNSTASNNFNSRCGNPLNFSEFTNQLDRVKSQNTASGKQLVAEKIAQTYCLTSQQVYELCNELYLGADKLSLAKFCYSRCYDPQNYEVVYRALSISSMVRELDNFIKQQGGSNQVVGNSNGNNLGSNSNSNTIVVYVPGYNGPVGCAMPMRTNDFNAAVQSIEDADFENTKLSTAKTIVGANCITTDQVISICNLFGFEDTKLQFAKFAYSKTYDKGNYFKINKVFDFDASKETLNRFVQNGGR